jgi:hypothetical protein
VADRIHTVEQLLTLLDGAVKDGDRGLLGS